MNSVYIRDQYPTKNIIKKFNLFYAAHYISTLPVISTTRDLTPIKEAHSPTFPFYFPSSLTPLPFLEQ